jgi:hypothetical protein
VVDDELDGSSPRPISNSAVTREIIKILDDCERTRDAVTELYVTPQMFGAIGDGKADDTEAIQYCLDNYKDVVLPAGTYIISKSLVMKKKGQTLKGMSSDAVIKAANGFSGDMLVMDGTATSAYRSNQQLSSVGIVGNGLCNGLRFKMNADFFVRNVIVSGCEWGIVSGDSLLYHVFGTMVCECTNGVKFENSANLSAANNVCFDMCQIISIAKYAIYSESETELLFLKRVLESSVFDYYVRHTSKPYSTGYYSYAKNYVKSFGIYPFTEEQKNHLLTLKSKTEVDNYVKAIYGLAI